MTWLAADVIPSARTPSEAPEPAPTPGHVPPRAQGMPADTEGPSGWDLLSPSEKDLAARTGQMSEAAWEYWRHVLTRGIDGLL